MAITSAVVTSKNPDGEKLTLKLVELDGKFTYEVDGTDNVLDFSGEDVESASTQLRQRYDSESWDIEVLNGVEHSQDKPDVLDRTTEDLFVAIANEDLVGMKAALGAGANVNALNAEGDRPIHLVAERGNQEMLQLLADAHVDVNSLDGQGWAPVHRAVRTGQPEMVQALLEEGARVKGQHEEEPPSHLEASLQEEVQPAQQEEPQQEENSIRPATKRVNEEEAVSPPAQQTPVIEEENAIRPVKRDGIAPSVAEVGQADTIAPAKASQMATSSPSPKSLLAGRFVGDDKGNYRRIGDEKICMVDESERIRFIDRQMDTFQAAVELAKHKGWDAIEVTGSDRFRSDAWYVARKAGLEVAGYEPTKKDLDRLNGVRETDAHDHMSESRRAAEKVALSKIGAVKDLDEAAGRYVGRVVGETEHHFVQDIGLRMAVIHEKDKFSGRDAGKALRDKGSLKIQYRGGKAEVESGKQQDRGTSLGR